MRDGEEVVVGAGAHQKLRLLRRVRRVTEAMSAARSPGLRRSSLRRRAGQEMLGQCTRGAIRPT